MIARLAFVLGLVVLGCSADRGDAEGERLDTSEAALEAAPASEETRYYAVVFGMEDGPNTAAGSHSFATYIRTSAARFDVTTISWLPASYRGTVCVDLFHLRCPPERGHVFTLEETLALGRNRRIAMWGPFEIRAELYERAVAQERRLKSGAIRYVANDFGLAQSAWPAINCVHALTNVLYFQRLGITWGIAASRDVVVQMLPWVVDRTPVPWVEQRLALPAFGIIHER